MRLMKCLTRLVPAALLALAFAGAGTAQAQGFASGQEYWERARIAADQNRYIVRQATAPAPNMEPRMVHQPQQDETRQKLERYLAQHKKRPNVLIFIVDDMGWGDFGAYGGGLAVGSPTPNVDQLAREGLMLTSTYAQPSCSPTRATIHTGQLPIQHGVLSPPMYGDPGGITPESVTLPMLLKRQGYVTRGVGKWHMGEGLKNLPSVVGYDEYFGFLDVSDMYTEWRDPAYNPEVALDEERTRFMQNRAFNHYLVLTKAGGPPEEQCKSLREIVLPWEAAVTGVPTQGFYKPCEKASQDGRVSISELDKIWAEYSEKFIRGMQGSDKPWFLYHATRGCHFDNYPREETQRKSYARTTYSDCTVEVDEILGQLMKALKETGQDRETLVFFTSDNGPEQDIEVHGHTPFRGGKGSTWEGGVRVPGIAWWPGMIESGRQSDGLFDLADLYPTLLALAGFDYAKASNLKDRYCYGVDQASFLLAKDGVSNRRSVLYWYMTHFAAVRMDEFKAHRVVTLPVGLHEGNLGGFAGVNLPQSYMWLFNLHDDPQEQRNIFIRHLWNQGLFTGEFQRFMCTLINFPPKLPTQPVMHLFWDDGGRQIQEDLPQICQPSA
jgi:arylsulfatase A-like enzyme